jgi:TRAP-type C4-dicarboxylate transport system permease small subunit
MSKAADLINNFREKLKHVFGNIFEIIAVLFFVGFFISILMQIFTRYVIHYPLQWTEEFARILYVGMVCIAAAAAVDEHSRVKIFLDYVKKHSFRGYLLLTLLIDLSAWVVLVYILVGSYNRTVYGWAKHLPATGLKWAYLYLPLLIGSAMLMIFTILHIGSTIFRLQQKTGMKK